MIRHLSGSVYPTILLIAKNAEKPITALMGIVSIHAHMILRATPHFTALVPVVDPTPMIAAQMTWVVLTGIPATEAPMMVVALAVSAANP